MLNKNLQRFMLYMCFHTHTLLISGSLTDVTQSHTRLGRRGNPEVFLQLTRIISVSCLPFFPVKMLTMAGRGKL